jgi:hypothetical protein
MGKCGEKGNPVSKKVLLELIFTHSLVRSAFLVGTLSLISYLETNIVVPNLLIWELNLLDILV